VWDQLTGEEKEEFQKMLRDGRIGHLLDNYTPWWKVSTSIPFGWVILVPIKNKSLPFTNTYILYLA